MQNQAWPVPICTPRAENKLDTPRAEAFRDPCKPNEQHGPCWAARPVCGRMKMARLTDTPRVEDPCRPFSLLHGPWRWPVCGRMKMARLTDTPRVEDPCCFLPSASCCSAHSGSSVLSQELNDVSPRIIHYLNCSKPFIQSLIWALTTLISSHCSNSHSHYTEP